MGLALNMGLDYLCEWWWRVMEHGHNYKYSAFKEFYCIAFLSQIYLYLAWQRVMEAAAQNHINSKYGFPFDPIGTFTLFNYSIYLFMSVTIDF